MIYGYARVSTKEQNLQLQLDALTKYGVDKIIKDKISTKKTREQLNLLLKTLKQGDTIVIWKLDRLGRSLRQLLELVDDFEKRGISFVSLNDTIDTKTPFGRVFFAISGAFAQLERETISMRTIAGLESARARGRIGGRPKKDKKSIEIALKMYQKGFPLSEIQKTVRISPHTLYKYLRIEIILLFNAGVTIAQIAEKTNCRTETIERWLDNAMTNNK